MTEANNGQTYRLFHTVMGQSAVWRSSWKTRVVNRAGFGLKFVKINVSGRFPARIQIFFATMDSFVASYC